MNMDGFYDRLYDFIYEHFINDAPSLDKIRECKNINKLVDEILENKYNLLNEFLKGRYKCDRLALTTLLRCFYRIAKHTTIDEDTAADTLMDGIIDIIYRE